MNDKKSISTLVKKPSILAEVINTPNALDKVGDSSELRLELAQRLEALETEASKSRAAFIRNQNTENFNANREAWGIPNFSEELEREDNYHRSQSRAAAICQKARNETTVLS